MAITFDFASGTSTGAGAAALTLTSTHIVANQSNNILLVNLGMRVNTTSGTSVTYSGIGATQQNLTFLNGFNSSIGSRTEIWYLTNPTQGTGGSGTIVSTLGAVSKYNQNSATYYGVDTASPFGISGTQTATSTTPSITLTTTNANAYILGHLSIRADTADTFSVTSPNTTSRGFFGTVGGAAATNNQSYIFDRTTTTAGSYPISGTITASDEFSYQAWEMKEFVGGLGTTGRGYITGWN
jgi:hypothetical protein